MSDQPAIAFDQESSLRKIYNPEKIKTGLAIFGICILALIAIELLSRLTIFVADNVLQVGATEARAYAPAYDGANYDPFLLVDEQEKDGVIYQPYTIWKAEPYKGTYHNVDEESHRLTVYNSQRDDAVKIWMLGGSTMFGSGAPDDQTVPSQLAKLFNQTWGLDTRVQKLGQPAYVSTQEVISLIQKLKQGQRPDVVVFYDGFNDSLPSVPGAHLNFTTIRDKYQSTLIPLIRSLASYEMAQQVLRRLPGASAGVSGVGKDPSMKGEQAVDVMLGNYRVVKALGETYGFVPVFLFQPANGSGEKPYDPSEQRMVGADTSKPGVGLEGTTMEYMRRTIQERLQGEDNLNYYDISDVFKDHPEPLYVDFVHVTGVGNQIIADRMFGILKDELCSSKPPHLSEFAEQQLTSACG